MQKQILSICLLLLCITSIAQQKSINYYLPDSVEVKIFDEVKLLSNNKKFYCVLENIGKDTFLLSVCQYQLKDKKRLESWVFSTNRKVVIKDRSYPLLLDYDYKFSTLDTLKVGKFGDRANKITKQLPILHCYSVKFTKYYILDNQNISIGYANKQAVLE
jgi:hypothetical protein